LRVTHENGHVDAPNNKFFQQNNPGACLVDVSGRARIGTSGWMYKHWRGDIYEKGFPQRRWLSRVAEVFETVEVNTSFYRIPSRKTVESWVAETPESFQFALKLWRGITHYRKLLNARELTERFLESADALPPSRRAPLLIQLPPHQKPNLPKLTAYVKELRTLSGNGWRIAIEFRDDEWLTPNVYDALDHLNVAVCLHDMRGKGATEHAGRASFVYVRRHGSAEQLYTGSYAPEAIQRDATNIREWQKKGRDVFVYYNNDVGGHAWRNAQALRSMTIA
jgi:uncharacterized protein YecE (DUF72 family)